MIPLSDALLDPDLFRPWFPEPETFRTWFAMTAAMEGLPLTDDQFELFKLLTGRTERPKTPAREVWVIAGRRAAKTRQMAMHAVWKATSFDYARSGMLAPGERAVASMIAVDKKQAKIGLRYVGALINGVPELAKMKTNETQEGFEFSNGASIEVQAASFRGIRGRSFCFVGVDEVAFLRSDESANPDTELYVAALPGLATIKNSLFWGSSSPWAKRGLLYDKYVEHWGKNGDDEPLVFKGGSKIFNPTLSDKFIQQMVDRDPAAAQSEWFGEFRNDVDAFVSREAVEQCVSKGVFERPPVQGRRYFAFCDPSGGTSDAMTMAIGHREDRTVVIDALRERAPPFSPEAVVAQFCDTLKSYGLTSVTGDRYAAEWPREQFRNNGISYRLAEKPRSDLYLAFLPALTSKSVDLLDTEKSKLVLQIISLERRVGRSGKEVIDHARNAHDDLCNSVAGVVAELTTRAAPACAVMGSYSASAGVPAHSGVIR